MTRESQTRSKDDLRQLYSREMAHRLKNLLARVTGLVVATLRNAPSTETAADKVRDRLHAMGRVYDILGACAWRAVPLGDLVARELNQYGQHRLRLEGTQILLTPEAGLATAMIVHELGTNARQHGALATEHGTVKVGWSDDAGTLVIDWRERGTRINDAAPKKGFGISLIEGLVRHELEGTSTFTFAPDGARCRIAIAGRHMLSDDTTEAEAEAEIDRARHASAGLHRA